MSATIGQIAGLAVQLSFGVGSIVAGVMIFRPRLFDTLVRVRALCMVVMWCAVLYLEWVKP